MPDGTASFEPDAENARAFRTALGKFSTGVTIVTCTSGMGPVGMTANSFSSVSLDPALVLWSAAKSSRRCAAFEAAQHFAIHVLADTQLDLCQRFAADGYAFDGTDWHLGAFGVPLINGCLARFECTRHAVHEGGDHVIIVGKVHAAAMTQGQPLVFSEGRFGQFAPIE